MVVVGGGGGGEAAKEGGITTGNLGELTKQENNIIRTSIKQQQKQQNCRFEQSDL